MGPGRFSGGASAPPRKLGGILLEAHAGPTPGVVAGCGLNVQVSPAFFAAQALTGAVTLAMTPSRPRREELLAEILAAMEQRYQEWDASQWSRALQAWEDLDALRGGVVAVERGGERCHGTARGITPFGLLLLESADGSQLAFGAGEVHLS